MIRELKPYRFYCDWKSDNAACANSEDLQATTPAEGVAYLVYHRRWRSIGLTLFCPDCKNSSMADDLEAARTKEHK